MSQSAKPIHVGRDVSFRTPDGDRIECVTVWLWNTSPLSARLLLTSYEWDRVRTTGLFEAAALSLSALRPSVDALLVDLEAVDPSHPTDARILKKRFADPDSMLRSTDAWTATRVRNHESTASAVDGAESSEAAAGNADIPNALARVSDFGVSLHHSSAPVTPGSLPASHSATDPADWADLTEPLSHVAAALTAENWSFEPSADGSHLSLTASVDDAAWRVIIEDDGDGHCLIRSVYPDRLGTARRVALQPAIDEYTETLNRGGFVVDSTGHVEFRTPFDPQAEPTDDALSENVTSLAEWFDRLTN